MPERGPQDGRRVLTPDNTPVDLALASGPDISADFEGNQTLTPNTPDPLSWATERGIEIIPLPAKPPREPEPEVVIIGGKPGEEVYFP